MILTTTGEKAVPLNISARHINDYLGRHGYNGRKPISREFDSYRIPRGKTTSPKYALCMLPSKAVQLISVRKLKPENSKEEELYSGWRNQETK